VYRGVTRSLQAVTLPASDGRGRTAPQGIDPVAGHGAAAGASCTLKGRLAPTRITLWSGTERRVPMTRPRVIEGRHDNNADRVLGPVLATVPVTV